MATAQQFFTNWLKNPLQLMPNTAFNLASVLPKAVCIIESIHSEEAQLMLLRFGVGVGDKITVLAKLPAGGPLVLQCGQVELALGQQYAQHITVTIV
ncbi:MAG: ferrous iron transport protein A [Vampirovibrio sp.]|jgi:Fe2+ transport system protein FeoA|nr:ferrous iron transport protein A [Vampirovibrio sp.]